MRIPANMLKLLIDLFMISLFTTFSTVLGCGVMPAGQMSTRTFNVTGFTTLPVNMVYTSAMNAARVPGIATSQEGARGFVSRLVMQAVFDVLESNGRSAFLPDAVISTILGQLTLNITYDPMLCQAVILNLTTDNVDDKKPQNCIIVSNTVTGICTKMREMLAQMLCDTTCRCYSGYPRRPLDNIRSPLDYKHHHGELVENDVAKCSEQSGSNVGSEAVWIALLLGSRHR
ncbi:hypothetical protein KIN20_021072 [Parelaphostrongylus tenuis]|uniref:Uncharacterized protein n=1 Tax=Parelaphostrongylus tenuis TaxID=148309 RepID=A0AAD5NAG0_PARTN|nr:hypothetical protein KIN20_021072 [Parelaphostrongylus tenuis]